MKAFWSKEMRMTGKRLLVVVLVSAGLGALGGGMGTEILQGFQSLSTARPLRQSDIPTTRSEYRFIDPLIAVRGVSNSDKYNDIRNSIQSYLDAQKKNGLTVATVYFRDINAQDGFTLNPDERYTPASLFKVPLMMVYYKIAERTPSIMSDSILYTGAVDHNEMEQIKSPVQLVPGTRYTVEELIEHLIRYSDNNAAHLLTDHLQETKNVAEYATVFTDLGIDLASLTETSASITTPQYALFLRALYNATYLDRDDSERALKLMSETEFAEGIEAGVPSGTPVAQKFGEVRMTNAEGALLGKQLHDCGIVYYPKHPYLLCVMTKHTGDSVAELEADISSVSSIAFKGMQKLYP